MKTLLLQIVLLLGILHTLKSQVRSIDEITLYRTEDDFFNRKNKVVINNAVSLDEYLYKLEYMDKATDKKKKFNITDSSFYAIEFVCEGLPIKKLKSGQYNYIMFGGGTKDIHCTVGAINGSYDEDGFIQSIKYLEWFEIYYADNINKIYSKKIEDLLKTKPKLLEKYQEEKKESDRKAWKRNKIPNEMRYLKLYIKEYTT